MAGGGQGGDGGAEPEGGADLGGGGTGGVAEGGNGGSGGDGGAGGAVECACQPGESQACVTACGTEGTQACLADCSAWGACVGPAESCDGQDNDCNDQVDDGLLASGADVTNDDIDQLDEPHVATNGTSFAVAFNHPSDGLSIQVFDASVSALGAPQEVEPNGWDASDAEIAWNGSRYGVVWTTSANDDAKIRFFDASGAALGNAITIDSNTSGSGVDIVADGSDFVAITTERIVRYSTFATETDSLALSTNNPHIAQVGSGFLVFSSSGTCTQVSSALNADAATSVPPLLSVTDATKRGSNVLAYGVTATGAAIVELDVGCSATGDTWEGLGGTTAVLVDRYMFRGGLLSRFDDSVEVASAFDLFTMPNVDGGKVMIAFTGTTIFAVADNNITRAVRVTGDLVCDAP